jgi:hypothetical protein
LQPKKIKKKLAFDLGMQLQEVGGWQHKYYCGEPIFINH